MGVNIIEGKSCKNAGSALVGSRFFTAFFFQYNYLEERKEHNMSQQVYPQINRVVQTESGALRGVPAGIPQYTVFKGVPYAAPPVGNLRWKEPQPVIPWKGVRDAARFGPILSLIHISEPTRH